MSQTEPITSTVQVKPWLHPLDEFYAQAGMVLPAIERIAGEQVPEPYRQLLVHERDMTPTLEQFYGSAIHLEVLRREQRGDYYYREVILLLDDTNRPVEFGAIKIALTLFPPAARRQILEERLPLGRILHDAQLAHTSKPKAYLQIESDEFIRSALKLECRTTLFGRRNTLSDGQQRALAEIVEILPP